MKLKPSHEVWFPVPDDPEKGEVLIRHLNKSMVQSITQKLSENRTTWKSDRPEMISVSNAGQIVEALCIGAIRDWKNFNNIDGRPLKCTDENKKLFLIEVEGFLEFVNQCRNDLAVQLRKEEDAAAKN